MLQSSTQKLKNDTGKVIYETLVWASPILTANYTTFFPPISLVRMSNADMNEQCFTTFLMAKEDLKSNLEFVLNTELHIFLLPLLQ